MASLKGFGWVKKFISRNRMDLSKLFQSLPEENKQFLLEFLAIVYQLQFGTLQPVIKIHRGRIKEVEFRGWKRLKYTPDNQNKAIQDLAERIRKAKESKQKTKLVFIVETRGGYITDILWDSFITRRYEVDKQA